MDNMITAVFGALRVTRTVPRHQWDTGQKLRFAGTLRLPNVYEVHLANKGEAEAARILSDGSPVDIPDELFQSGKDILAWVYVQDSAEEGQTEYMAVIPVLPKAKPEDYTPTPRETGIVEQAIELLNQEIDDIENAHQNALDAQAAQRAAETARDAAGESEANASQSATDAARDASSAADSARNAGAAQIAAEAARDRAEQAADDAETHSIGMRLQGTTLVLTSPREG